MSTAITVKILQGPIARRFTVPGTSLFPKIAAVEDIQLSYVDDDGDQVIFNTDIELNEALQQAVTTGNKKAVRFWLVETIAA
ncbi:hypothetical protein BDF19DRAFT_419089 [Syncephalis fuscata]|nr:hypothetical protein BDF19DRAFT_419089 [Syncephalis fuscata]